MKRARAFVVYSAATAGLVSLCSAQQPANDSFDGRIVLAPFNIWDPNSSILRAGSTMGATMEEGEPPVQSHYDGSGSVWYEWVPGVEGWTTITLKTGLGAPIAVDGTLVYWDPAKAQLELFDGDGFADLTSTEHTSMNLDSSNIKDGSLIRDLTIYARAGQSVFLRVTSELATGFSLDIEMAGAAGSRPEFTSSSTTRPRVGEPFVFQITTTGEYRPQMYGIGSLPPGLTLNATTGLISGIPTTCALTETILSAKNVAGTSSMTFRFYVDPADPLISGPLDVSGVVGVPIGYQVQADHVPIRYAADGLPVGVSLNPETGWISGSPVASGTYHVGLTVFNSEGASSCELVMTIAPSEGGLLAEDLSAAAGAEYFLDNDPGVGNGNPISVSLQGTGVDWLANLGAEELADLGVGIHRLGLRVRNHENRWSTSYQRTFEVVAPEVAPLDPIAIEYYLDADPEQGSGIGSPALAEDGKINITPELGASMISGLQPGVHRLACRVLDGNGAWSIAYQRPFEVVAPELAPADPVAIEYYLDTDPQTGGGISYPVATENGGIIATPELGAAKISALQAGLHRLACRVLDANGAWSIAYQRPFEVVVPEVLDSRIDRVEYQWFANGSAVAAAQSVLPVVPTTSVSLHPTAAVSALLKGDTYQLVVTPYDKAGNQGISATASVLMNADPPTGYEKWAAELPVDQRGMLQDPGDQGIVNLLRYAFGMAPGELDRTHLPQLSLSGQAGDAERHLAIRYRRFASADGLQYRIEGSDDLIQWSPSSGERTEQAAQNGNIIEVTFTENAPIQAGTKRFLRVRVER